MSETESGSPTDAVPAPRAEWNRRGLSAADAHIVRQWWQRLTQTREALRDANKGGPPPWPRSVRAVLKRCETPESALLTEGFRHLWFMLESRNDAPSRPRDVYRWACVALMLAHVDHERPDVSLGRRLGAEKKNTGRPLMSELRFQQLMSCETPDELVRRLRRGLDLVDREGLSVTSLAAGILQWNMEYDNDDRLMGARPTERVRFQWANDYFTVLAPYQREAAS
ncbi:MAG: type I-E CRISPR-associated protein Cse2/CasB [Salinisphaera sp.]|jgi:CRISPR system Cascade subunit CasB|nr:type I-E CRISPR-associated protein Cse2/CasB [Salinisphaera sp.]